MFGSTETIVGDVFFDVPMPEEISAPKAAPTVPNFSGTRSTGEASFVKDKNILKGQTPKKKEVPKRKSPAVVKRHSGRRTTILDLLKRQKKVSVRNVADVITGVSEKTLQRELLALVQEGIVVKEGERRWSTYSLK